MKAIVRLTVLALGTATARLASADEPPVRTDPQQLFEQARELVLAKRFAEACPLLAESQRVDPGLGTMLWLADCYEHVGRTASAWSQFNEAASYATLHHDARAPVAERRAARLASRVPRIAIMTPAHDSMPGLAVRLDGVELTEGQLGAPIPVDPGIHALAVSAPGRSPWSGTVEAPAGERPPLLVNLPVLPPEEVIAAQAAPLAVPASAPSAPALSPPVLPLATAPRAHVERSSWGPFRVTGLTLAAAGAVGMGVGAFLGLRAKAALDASNANGHCLATNECDPTGKGHRADATGLAAGSTLAFVAGSATLIGGLAIFLLAPSAKTVVAPALGAQGAGAVVTRRF